MPPDVADMLREARKIKSDPDIYVAMIDDWIANGRESRYALAPDEVVRRSDPRTDAEATAAAEFELGQYLHRAGDHAAAIPHWREAHRLYPDNWTYKRQAWNFEDPMRQGHTDAYDSSWYEDIKKIGAENYYPEIVSLSGSHRHPRRSRRRRRDGVVAAAGDGRHGRPHDHDRVPALEAARRRTRGRAHAHRAAQRVRRVRDVPRAVGASRPASPRTCTQHLDEWRTWPGYTDRQRLAIEYAERFATDHRAIDDELFARLRAQFADDEILDLTLCCAVFLGLGRTLEVLGITDNCPLDI